jgi:hypothetical protein
MYGAGPPRAKTSFASTPPINEFKSLSDAGGGELKWRTPLRLWQAERNPIRRTRQSCARDRPATSQTSPHRAPPGHHCLPTTSQRLCLLQQHGIAIEAARAAGLPNALLSLDITIVATELKRCLRPPDVLTVFTAPRPNYPGHRRIHRPGNWDGTGYNQHPLPGTGQRRVSERHGSSPQPTIRKPKPDVLDHSRL